MKSLYAPRAVLCLLLLSLMLGPYSLRAAEVLVGFDNPAHSELYDKLLREYRCLKCQNQNLADSKAGLADDLRREIREQILAGNTARDIDEYLVSRYGEFVLYRPRFNMKTAVLWIGPFALLLLGLVCLYVMVVRVSRRSSRPSLASDEDVQDRDSSSIPVSGISAATEAETRLERARKLLDD